MKNKSPVFFVTSLITAMVVSLSLTGCSTSEDDSVSETPEAAAAEDHVWQTQTDALEKAQQVEQVLQDSAADRKRKIDEAVDPD